MTSQNELPRKRPRIAPITKYIIVSINLAILVAVAVWLRNNISLDAVLVYLAGVPTSILVAVLILNILLMFAYGFRLACVIDQKLLPSLGTILLGFGLQGILPFRLGDLMKIVYANRFFRIPPGSLVAGTALEKILDLATLSLIVIWASQGATIAAVKDVGGTVVVLFLIGVALFVAALWSVHRWRRLVIGRADWLLDAVDLTLRNRKPRTLIAVIFWTAVIWFLTVATIYVVFSSLFEGFKLHDAAILSLILSLAIALPGTPAGLGVVEAGVVGYLHQMLNVDPNQALAAAFAFHFVTVIPQILAAVAIIAWNWSLAFGRRK